MVKHNHILLTVTYGTVTFNGFCSSNLNLQKFWLCVFSVKAKISYVKYTQEIFKNVLFQTKRLILEMPGHVESY